MQIFWRKASWPAMQGDTAKPQQKQYRTLVSVNGWSVSVGYRLRKD
jgi:hypothetical protein